MVEFNIFIKFDLNLINLLIKIIKYNLNYRFAYIQFKIHDL